MHLIHLSVIPIWCKLKLYAFVTSLTYSGADTGFLKGGLPVAGIVGLQNQWGISPMMCQFENWDIENYYNRNPRNATSKEQFCYGTCLECFSFILYIIFTFFIYFSNLASPKRGWLATQLTPLLKKNLP